MKLTTRLILVGTMALSVACGATPEPVTAASQARASGLVIALHVDNDAKGLRESLAETLTSAGYTVVPPRADKKEVDIVANAQVTTSDTRKVGILTLKGVDDMHVRLVLERPDGGHLAVIEDSLSGDLTESDLAPMARQLFESRATTSARAEHRDRAAFQAAHKKREDDEEQRRIEAALEARKEEKARLAKAEEDAWTSSRDECATASRSTSCDALAKFAFTYSKSTHASEAEALVAKSRVRMLELKDDEAWAEAAPNRCTSPRDEQACEGVTRYVMANPEGRHTADAAKLIKAAEPTFAKLRREREAKEAREAAVAQADASTYYDGGGYSGYSGGGGSRRGGAAGRCTCGATREGTGRTFRGTRAGAVETHVRGSRVEDHS